MRWQWPPLETDLGPPNPPFHRGSCHLGPPIGHFQSGHRPWVDQGTVSRLFGPYRTKLREHAPSYLGTIETFGELLMDLVVREKTVGMRLLDTGDGKLARGAR